jgi:hypothetical protein
MSGNIGYHQHGARIIGGMLAVLSMFTSSVNGRCIDYFLLRRSKKERPRGAFLLLEGNLSYSFCWLRPDFHFIGALISSSEWGWARRINLPPFRRWICFKTARFVLRGYILPRERGRVTMVQGPESA